MSSRVAPVVSWLIIHRSQVQIVITTLIFALVLLSIVAPQVSLFAGDAPGGGHTP
jgi:hypothetical protein